MMETITVTVFSVDELSSEAQARVFGNYRKRIDYAWGEESRESVAAFCSAFNVSLTDWRVDSCRYDFSTNATSSNFRGVKLRDSKRDHMPTGYCLDCDLWQTFFDVFKKTGDAKNAFDSALHAGFSAWRDDMGHQESDECILETLHANGWRFFADGSEYRGQ